MEKIKIHYGIQGNGLTFSLLPSEMLRIKTAFPKSQPAHLIFVSYERQSNFENYRPNLERYVFPALLGFENMEDLKKIDKIEFIKTPEMQVTYTIEQNYELEEQSLSR